MIDEDRQAFVAQIKAELSDRDSGELLLTKRYLARYPLVEEEGSDEDRASRLLLGGTPAGALEIDDVFERDWKRQGGPA